MTTREQASEASNDARCTPSPDSLPSMAEMMEGKKTKKKNKDGTSAKSSPAHAVDSGGEKSTKEVGKGVTGPFNLDFQVASPNLSRMIDDASDTSSPVSFRYDTPTPTVEKTEEELEEAPPEGEKDEKDIETTEKIEGNDDDQNVEALVGAGDAVGTMEPVEIAYTDIIADSSIQITRRGKRGRFRGRPRGRRGSRGGGRGGTVKAPVILTPAVVRRSGSTSDSLPDLAPMVTNDPEVSATSEVENSKLRNDLEKAIAESLAIEPEPMETNQNENEERISPHLPNEIENPADEEENETNPLFETETGTVTPVSRPSPRGRGRGRGRGRMRGRSRGKSWTNVKKRRRSSAPTSTPPRSRLTSESVTNFGEEPQYEGVSPSVPENMFQTPTDTPVKAAVDNSEAKGLQDVEKRMEEIQSLVSNIQKDSSSSSPTKPPGSPRGNVAKKRTIPCRPSPKSSPGRSRKKSSPARSGPEDAYQAHGDLKMTIKLGDKRGKKRNRYSEDGDYQPFAKKRSKLDSQTPTRSSGRRNEYDVFLDRYRYLGGLYSDDSRSPSPLTVVTAPVLKTKCKPCQVQLFDFAKCFNIRDLNDMKDSTYNKGIRRQIRALEKGHQVAKRKAGRKVSETKTSTSEKTPLPLLSIQTDGQGHTTSSLVSPFASHLGDVIDDVIGKKKKRKKRKKSGNDKEEVEAPEASLDVSAETVDTVSSEPSVSGVTPKKKFKCRQCTFITADLPCMQEHVNLHEEPFHCSECSAIFPQLSRAVEHTIQEHADSPARVVRKLDFSPNDYFDEILESGDPIQLSSKSTDEKETNYQCQLCPFRTDDRQVIESHLQTNHRAEYQYVCRICDLAFCRKRETMLKHFKKWHPDQALDFTTAPGVQEKATNKDVVDITGDEGTEKNAERSRPSSVISIASEGSVVDGGKEKHATASVISDEVQVIEPTVTIEPTPEVLGVESRPCLYKCRQCGAKTDTFDVICAHLEVSHADADFSFACPFCDDYKARTCSFVAEHIRTAHPENSGRCMERRLEKANLYVIREVTGQTSSASSSVREKSRTPSTSASASAPARTESPRTNNQENKSPDDEVMILDSTTSTPARPPLQPLTVVHHGPDAQPAQTPTRPPPPPQQETVEVFPGFSVTKVDFNRYQVFNLKPPRFSAPPPVRPRPPAQNPQEQVTNPMTQQLRYRAPNPGMTQNGAPRAPMRAPPPVRHPHQPPQSRPVQPRPMPTLQPRPYNVQQNMPQPQVSQMQQQMPSAMYFSQMQMPQMQQTSPNVPQMSPTSMGYPQLMQVMGGGMIPTSMAQPMLFNGLNQPR